MSSTIPTVPDPKTWPQHRFGLPSDRWAILAGKSFLVTGAGTGFGRSIACSLAAAGAVVILNGRRPDKLTETRLEMESLGISPERCFFLQADITNRDQVEKAANWLQSTVPALNGIVHCAALPSHRGSGSPLLTDPEEIWNRTLATNLTAPWLLTRVLFPHLLKSGSTRVVFLSSGAGWSATPGKGVYNVSKAALNAMAQSLAAEASQLHPGTDIQINTLVPGEARTEMNPEAITSPYAIVPSALALLSHPEGGPNGQFFGMDGTPRGFGSAKPHDKRLFEVRSQNAPNNQAQPGLINRPILNNCLKYDSSPQDRQFLGFLAQALRSVNQPLALYGAGRLATYLLEQNPDLIPRIQCIADDDREKTGRDLFGLPIVKLDELPNSIEVVFACSTRFVSLMEMVRKLSRHPGQLKYFSTVSLVQEQPGIVPPHAVVRQPPSIYPITIPPIEFQSGMDLILLELPPRYLPMMPNGLAHVHNIVKSTGIRHQTLDLNIIFYHRYFTRLLCDGEQKQAWFKNDENRTDPWENFNTDEWHDPAVVDFFRDDLDETINGLIEAAPKILGISLNGNNRHLAREIIQRLKEAHPKTVILVGGYDCTNPTLAISNFGDFDYMVLGESELTLPGLVKDLVVGRRPSDLDGIISRFDTSGRLPQTSPMPHDLDMFGFPTYDWVDPKVYRNWNGAALTPISSSRGCAWSRCNFCSEAKAHHKRDPMNVVDEIEWHVKRGFNNFASNESDVNGDPETLLEICNEIIRRNLKIRFVGQLRIDRRSDLDFFKTLKAAGFDRLTFGVDGWTDHVLYLQRKGYRFETVEQNLADCRKAGLAACVNMVVGVPGETEEDVDETIQNVLKNKDNILIFTTINMMRLFVASRYYEDPEKYGIRFRGDKEQIYREHHFRIPEELWYSENPYIDRKVRAERYQRILSELQRYGVPMGDFTRVANAREIGKINSAPASSTNGGRIEPIRAGIIAGR